MAGQVRHPNPGQNQETRVVGQQAQMALTLLGIPANPLVPRRGLPSRRAEQQAGQRAALPVPRQVLQVLARRNCAAPDNDSAAAGTGRADASDVPSATGSSRTGCKLPSGPSMGVWSCSREAQLGDCAEPLTEAVRRGGNRIWPRASSLSSRLRAGHVLEPASPVAPVPSLAQLTGKPRAIRVGMASSQSRISATSSGRIARP